MLLERASIENFLKIESEIKILREKVKNLDDTERYFKGLK